MSIFRLPTRRADDRAVSPAVGTVLMVTLVVLLAAILGLMVLSFEKRVSRPAPVITFDAEYTPSGAGNSGKPYINITFESGEVTDGDDLLIKDGDGNAVTWEEVWTGAATADTPDYVHIDGYLSDDELNHICEAGQTYYVVSRAGGDERVLFEYEIPQDPTSTPSGWC